MAKKLKALKKIITKRDAVDVKGIKISKGTTLHIMIEGPKHPSLGYRLLVVRVDNGTGHLDLMPETAVRDNEVK